MDIERKRQTQAVDVPRLLPTKAREGEEVDERCLSCNTVHGSPRLFRLPGGKLVSSYSEEFRLYTEARWVFKRFRTKRTRQLYLAEVANLRGQAAYHRLRDAMTEIWERSKNELS
jgi:hypothetical protein